MNINSLSSAIYVIYYLFVYLLTINVTLIIFLFYYLSIYLLTYYLSITCLCIYLFHFSASVFSLYQTRKMLHAALCTISPHPTPDKVSCNPGWPRTLHLVKDDLEFPTFRHLPSSRITSVCHLPGLAPRASWIQCQHSACWTPAPAWVFSSTSWCELNMFLHC